VLTGGIKAAGSQHIYLCLIFYLLFPLHNAVSGTMPAGVVLLAASRSLASDMAHIRSTEHTQTHLSAPSLFPASENLEKYTLKLSQGCEEQTEMHGKN
jgi:hypothetical protein